MSDYEDRMRQVESAHSSTIEDWRWRRRRQEEERNSAERSLRDHLREGLGEIGEASRSNIAKDILSKNISTNPMPEQYKSNNAGGFLAKARELDTDPITGFEPLPWDRDR